MITLVLPCWGGIPKPIDVVFQKPAAHRVVRMPVGEDASSNRGNSGPIDLEFDLLRRIDQYVRAVNENGWPEARVLRGIAVASELTDCAITERLRCRNCATGPENFELHDNLPTEWRTLDCTVGVVRFPRRHTQLAVLFVELHFKLVSMIRIPWQVVDLVTVGVDHPEAFIGRDIGLNDDEVLTDSLD